MDPDRLHDLFEAYIERRLTPDDRVALEQALRDSPDARRSFWQHIHQHAMLGELLAEARGRHLAAHEANLLDEPSFSEPPRPTRKRRHASWLLALAAILLFATGLGLWFWPDTHEPDVRPDPAGPNLLARLIDLRGDVFIVANQGEIIARAGQLVHPGEEIRTGENSSAVVSYPDASLLELSGDTAVRLLPEETLTEPTAPDKHVFLVKGAVHATVAPGKKGRPMSLLTSQANLLAPKSRFSSTSIEGETRIEMEEGRARLARKGDKRGIEIHTGTYAVSTGDPEVYRPAPMLPAGSKPAFVLVEGSGPILDLAILRDGPTLAYACDNGQVKLWNIITRKQRGVLKCPHRKAIALSVAPDGRRLAVGYEPGKNNRTATVLVWDTRKQKLLHSLDLIRRVQALTFTPDGKTLALTSAEKNRGALVWDLGDGRERLQLGDRSGPVLSLAVSPDGQLLATGCRDGIIRLYDLLTGRPAGTLIGHTRDVQALAFQQGGDVLASGSRDGTVRLWSIATRTQMRTLMGKFKEVRCLTFSPDGQTLVSGHAGIAILWEVATGRQRSALRAHKFAISAILYLPDGRTLVTAGWDRTIKLWDLQPVEPD